MSAYTFPGTATAQFEIIENPIWIGMADIAVANLGPILAASFAGGVTPTAGWQAQPYENLDGFKARIIADLKANGTLTGIAPGVLVTIYQRGAFWERNIIGKANLQPVAA